MQDLTHWSQRFLLYLRAERNASPHTLRAYQKDLSQYLAFLEDKYKSLALDRSHRLVVRDFLSELHGRQLQRATVLRSIAVLRAFYKYLLREEAIAQTPFSSLPMPKKEKKLPRFLSEDEMTQLLELPMKSKQRFSLRDAALLELLYSTGMRVAELCALNIEDIDVWGGMVRVFGKGSRERLVPVGASALRMVHGYLESRVGAAKRNGPLLLNASGSRLSDRGARLVVARWVKQAALRQSVSPHAFRHSFATHLLNRGCDLKTVQELLGHRNLVTTQAYTHVTSDHLKRIYQSAHPRA